MAKLPELAAQCAAHPAPILLLDTCALLDVIRIAGRDNPNDVTPDPAIAPAARHLLGLAQLPEPRVHLICYELVPTEWQANQPEVSRGPLTGLRRTQALLQRFNSTAAALGIPAPIYRPAQLAERDVEVVIERLLDLSQELLTGSKQLERLAACEALAVQRSITYTPPASKGKPELKDCLIIEHYLALCRQLPADVPRVFVSSNVSDYGRNMTLNPPLDAEFVGAGLQWAKDFAHARNLLAL
jgi:hypothetical protein